MHGKHIMNTANSIFKFVTIRNATNEVTSEPKFNIQPKTDLTNSLVTILSREQEQSEKIEIFNKVIDDFIKRKNFYKIKQELAESISKFSSPKTDKKSEAEIQNFYLNIYDNIVIRTITKK